MPHVVRITPRAQAELKETLAWLHQRSPQAAANWHARLLVKVQTLEQAPERCPLADEAAELGIELRELLFGKRSGVFRIVFTIDRDVVTVLRIRRASRDRLQPGDV